MSWFEHGESRIYYEQDGQGEPVLVLPGWGIGEFEPIRQSLAPHFRVIAADLPGSGKSEPQPREYSPTYFRDDAASFLAMLDAFHRLIDDPIPPLRDFAEYLKATYGEDNARAMTRSESNALRAIIEAGGDISRSRAADLACPVLLLTGEHDPFCPPALASAVASEIPRGEFVRVDDVGHDIHTARPVWLAETVTSWLQQRRIDGLSAQARSVTQIATVTAIYDWPAGAHWTRGWVGVTRPVARRGSRQQDVQRAHEYAGPPPRTEPPTSSR